MLNKHNLGSIQSGTDKEVYSLVTNCALYFATGGHLEFANQILSALWKYKLPHERDTWLADTAFTVLWDAAGTYPDFIPFQLEDIDSIERNVRGYVAMDRWAYKMPDKPWRELEGQDLLRKAFITAGMVKKNRNRMDLGIILNSPAGEGAVDFSQYMEKIGDYVKSVSVEPTDILPSSVEEMEALAMLKQMADRTFFSSDGFTLGAELAAKNGQTEIAMQFAKKWAVKYHENNLGFNFPLLACGRHVAPLLLQHTVAMELGISQAIAGEYLLQILKTLEQRMILGRSLVYGNLDWKELVQKISLSAIRIDGDAVYDGEVCHKKWIGFEGANANEIIQVERKLGVALPEDYKLFLSATNGIRAFPLCNPELLPVGEIDYLKNVLEPFSYDILANNYGEDGDDQAYAEKLSNTLVISKYPDEQMVWLIPENKERTRWQTSFYAPWVPGERRYPTFRFFMEDTLAGMEAYSNPINGSSSSA